MRKLFMSIIVLTTAAIPGFAQDSDFEVGLKSYDVSYGGHSLHFDSGLSLSDVGLANGSLAGKGTLRITANKKQLEGFLPNYLNQYLPMQINDPEITIDKISSIGISATPEMLYIKINASSHGYIAGDGSLSFKIPTRIYRSAAAATIKKAVQTVPGSVEFKVGDRAKSSYKVAFAATFIPKYLNGRVEEAIDSALENALSSPSVKKILPSYLELDDVLIEEDNAGETLVLVAKVEAKISKTHLQELSEIATENGSAGLAKTKLPSLPPLPQISDPSNKPKKANDILSFSWMYNAEPEPGLRTWRLDENNNWHEHYPSGRQAKLYQLSEEAGVNGCLGSIVSTLDDPGIDVFIPHLNCGNRKLLFRRDRSPWREMGEMINVASK